MFILSLIPSLLALPLPWVEPVFVSPRVRALGGVAASLSNDEWACWHNPLALLRVQGWALKPAGATFQWNQLALTHDPQDWIFGRWDQGLAKAQQTVLNPGWFWGGNIFQAAFLGPGLGLSGISRNQAQVWVAPADYRVWIQQDTGVSVCGALRFGDGHWRAGLSAQGIWRKEWLLMQNSPIQLAGQIPRQGLLTPVDLAFGYVSDAVYNPSLTVLIRRIHAGGWKVLGTGGAPEAWPSSWHLGFHGRIIQLPDWYVLMGVEAVGYWGVPEASDWNQWASRWHAGVEFNYKDVGFFRLGANDRYVSAGVEVASPWVQWHLTASFWHKPWPGLSLKPVTELMADVSFRF